MTASGPMTGTWLIKVTNKNVDSSSGKFTTKKKSFNATITDSADADTSDLSFSFLDDQSVPVTLTGRRIHHSFFLQSPSGGQEFTFISGNAAGSQGTAKTLTFAGSSVSQDSITFVAGTGKKTGP